MKVSHLYPTLCDPMTAACQAFLSFIISQCLLKFMSIESVMSSSHLILCHPLLLPSISSSAIPFSCLEWVVIPFFRVLSQPRDWTQVSCIAGWFFTMWATREGPGRYWTYLNNRKIIHYSLLLLLCKSLTYFYTVRDAHFPRGIYAGNEFSTFKLSVTQI